MVAKTELLYKLSDRHTYIKQGMANKLNKNNLNWYKNKMSSEVS